MESSMEISQKTWMEPPFDSVIPLLSLTQGLNSSDLKSAYYSDTATSMFIVAQLTIAKLWNQSRCPSIDEHGIFIYTMESYSFKKKEMMTFAGKWMELENIMLSEISQSQRTKG